MPILQPDQELSNSLRFYTDPVRYVSLTTSKKAEKFETAPKTIPQWRRQETL
jgi:hypothetical protein